MSQYVTPTSPKKRKTALLCAIFGGWLGLHYFYVGRFFMGLLYAFSCGLGCLGWIFSIIQIATGHFTDSHGFVLIE